MPDTDRLAERFEAERPRLLGVAYRILGSRPDADDAVQDAWLRLDRSDADDLDNLGAWLTTVVARLCLDRLRARRRAGVEDPLDALDTHVPDPVVTRADRVDPEHQAVLADSVGLALLVVLETLDPAERLAFVLHDMFAVPFEEVAKVVDRTPAAARQLASRARRRVQGAQVPDADRDRQREVVDAFVAAARDGDLDALIAVLDPDVVLRADAGPNRPAVSTILVGATEVASQALLYAGFAQENRPALVNGTAGVVAVRNGRPVSIGAFTVADGRIIAIEILADPERLAAVDLSDLDA